MRTLKRILVFILFTMALIGVVGGLKYKKVYAVNYSTVLSLNFEGEGYTAATVYNSTKKYPENIDNMADRPLVVYYGCVSTADKITGTSSCQMRWYKSASDKIPYVMYTFPSSVDVDIISFKYLAGTTDVDFKIEYSTTVDGNDFVTIATVNTTSTEVVSYSIDSTGDMGSTKTMRRFRIMLCGTAPDSGHSRFTLDDLYLGVESSAAPLSTPTNVSISGNVLSFDAVSNASSYNVGFFENEAAESPTKVVNINTTSYTFTQQSADGNNYIKLQTLGDGVDYLNSGYSNVGTYTYTDIPEKTIAQVSGFENETAAPYSYYDITGTVKSIANGDSPNIYITDGANDLYVYGLAETKGGSPMNASALGIEVGFIVRIKAYKTIYETTVELKGYLVSVTPNYGNQFASLNTFASLKVDYTSNFGVASENSNASLVRVTTLIEKVDEDISYAYILGFNPSIFDIYFTKNDATVTRLDPADVRLYGKAGNGNTMSITGRSGIKISKIVITLKSGYAATTAVTGASDADESIEGLVRTYTFDSPTPYAAIQNVGAGTDQARITDMTIYYEGSYASSYTINTETVAAEEKPLVSLMIGSRFTNTLKDNLTASGTTVTYGIAYAKTTDLGGSTLSAALGVIESPVHILEGTPVKVDEDGNANESGEYWQLGVSLNHIPETAYGTEITAAVYVCIDGTYYLMNTKAYSVKTVAEKYLKTASTSYVEHLGLLGYLANYAG